MSIPYPFRTRTAWNKVALRGNASLGTNVNIVGEPTSKWRWRNARYAAEYLLLRVLVGLLNILPLDFGSWLMGAVWGFIAPRLRRHEIALRHLTAAYPAKTSDEIEGMARSMWTQLGRTFAESLMIERIVEAGRLEDCTGPLIRKVKASGKGVVFVSLHTGNWELVIIPTITGGIQAAGVYQSMKNPEVDRYVALMRRGRYPRGLFTKGAGTARKLMRIVREGGAVALLADLRETGGLLVPFFERLAPSTTFPASLARANNALLVAARVVRTRGVHFRIEAEVLQAPETADRDADVSEATRGIHSLFERWVREYPEQWMWAHLRWGKTTTR
jgi:KDO2-lipid IV(A) lauroyltransferase